MRKFTDLKDREWTIDLTVLSVRDVYTATDVLLTGLWADDGKLMAELSTNVLKLVDVLYVLCRKQAETAGVSEDEFAESLGGDSLGEAGEALVRATADFFTSPEQRAALHLAMDKMKEAGTAATTMATKIVGEADANQLAKSFLDSAMNSLESPASTPTPESSAS